VPFACCYREIANPKIFDLIVRTGAGGETEGFRHCEEAVVKIELMILHGIFCTFIPIDG
jgi:hypothetical protein